MTDTKLREAAIELLNHLAYDHANAPENLEESIKAISGHARRYAAGVEAGRGELEAREHWVTRGVCPECHGCGDIRPEVGCPHCDATGCTELGRTVARLEEELEDMRSDAVEQAPEPIEGETGAEIGATEQAWIDADRFMREMAEVMTDEPLCPICDAHGCSACVHGVTALAIGEVYAAGVEAGRKGAK